MATKNPNSSQDCYLHHAREQMGATQQGELSCMVALHPFHQATVSSSGHSNQEQGWDLIYRETDSKVSTKFIEGSAAMLKKTDRNTDVNSSCHRNNSSSCLNHTDHIVVSKPYRTHYNIINLYYSIYRVCMQAL